VTDNHAETPLNHELAAGVSNSPPPAAREFVPPGKTIRVVHCENFLLGRLPEPVRDALAPSLAETPLRQGVVLQSAGRAVDHVYFPTSGMVSLVAR
jgi:hypothetical protein